MLYNHCNSDIITKLVHRILILLVLLIPIINFNEIKWSLGLSLNADRGGYYYVKYIKDVGFIIIILLSLIRRIKYTTPWTYRLLPFLAIFLIVHVLSSIEQSNFVLLCGIRWLLPFILFIFLYEFIDIKFIIVLSKYIYVIFILHIILQIIECFVMPPYNGITYFGLSGRVPGLFSHAHSGASFTCLTYILGSIFLDNKKKIFWISIVFSILLTMSSTGIITFIILFLLLHFSKFRYLKNILLLVPLLVYILYLNADTLTNRQSGSSESSLGTRIDIITDTFNNSDIISNSFGLATNAANTISASSKAFVADSFYASIIGNLGILSMVMSIVFIFFFICYNIKKQKYKVVSIILFYVLFSISTIITEVYPLNLFIAILFVFSLKYDNTINSYRNNKL